MDFETTTDEINEKRDFLKPGKNRFHKKEEEVSVFSKNLQDSLDDEYKIKNTDIKNSVEMVNNIKKFIELKKCNTDGTFKELTKKSLNEITNEL